MNAIAADPLSSLPRGAPEAHGVSSGSLLSLIDAAEREIDALHSIMIVRHGHVIAEGWWAPYAAGEPHMLFSLSKSFAATAVGLASAEGRLTIDDPVLTFFPAEAPAGPSDNLKAMRVRDLLMMSTGHHAADLAGFPFQSQENLVQRFLALPLAHKPGTHFVYNTPASFMLSAIVQKATGETLLDYLRPRLFEPLGIADPTWEANAQGISMGGFGLSVRTEDIARFGQLHLQRGDWGGRRLLPAEWVDLATSRQTSNGSSPTSEWEQGYGFQFWRCRHGFYRGDGMFGQFCIVMPHHETVVAITSGTRDMGGVMEFLWARLLPELRPAPLPANDAAAASLQRRLAGLTLAPQHGSLTSGVSARVSGKPFRFPSNEHGLETITLQAGETDTSIIARVAGRDHRIVCGAGAWVGGGEFFLETGPAPAAASGGWTAGDTFTARVCFYRTPYTTTLTLRFAGAEVTLDQSMNVSFGAAALPQLVGRWE